MSIALLPGSYDPMTLGHLDIVKRAVALYGEAVVAVMNNPEKNYAFTMQERTRIAELTAGKINGVRVIADAGLVVDLFDRLGAEVIVKGVRNDKDRAYEEKMAAWNLEKNPRAKTVFLQAADDFEEVSSTQVRQLLSQGEAPHGILDEDAIAYLTQIEKIKP